MRISRSKHFFITFCSFFVLGASFKVMTLVEGLTEVRPVNAIPPVAGLVSGPLGALACGIGNLFADLFGTFTPNSILGLIANFIAAFLPYRLWHLFSDETPNLHSKKNILLYIAISAVNSLTTAWFLSFGFCAFSGVWEEKIYTYVFFNNLGFSIGFGMPLLIILTSDLVSIECEKRRINILFKKLRIKTAVCAVYFLIMLIIFVCVFFLKLDPQGTPWLYILSALSLAGLVCQIV